MGESDLRPVLDQLRDSNRKLETRVAVLENENKNLKEDIQADKEDLKYLKQGIGRLLWLIGGGAVSTIMGWFILRGLGG